MKFKAIQIGVLVGIMMFGTAAGYADGIPMAALVTQEDETFIIVGNFSESDFSFMEANGLASSINDSLSLITDSDISVAFLTPGDLQGLGYEDADALNALVLAVEGADFYYIYLDIAKTASLQPSVGTGLSIKIDAFVADFGLLSSLSGDTLLYVASIEVPEFLVSILGTTFVRGLLDHAIGIKGLAQ